MKKIVLILTMITMPAMAEIKTYQCGEDCTATLDNNGILTISGSGKMYNYNGTTRYEIPWLNDASSINTVIVGKGITTIGNYAFFALGNLKNVELSSTVERVKDSAFDEVHSLQNITCFDSTIWEHQQNMNDHENDAVITLYCKGNTQKCEENFYPQSDYFKGIHVLRNTGKKIYTVEEAEKVSKKIGNTFRLRYK